MLLEENPCDRSYCSAKLAIYRHGFRECFGIGSNHLCMWVLVSQLGDIRRMEVRRERLSEWCNTKSRCLQCVSLFRGWWAPLMTDIVRYLFSLQGLVVKDEGDAAPHHLQPACAVEHGATLTHDRHWNTESTGQEGDHCRVRVVKGTVCTQTPQLRDHWGNIRTAAAAEGLVRCHTTCQQFKSWPYRRQAPQGPRTSSQAGQKQVRCCV